MEDSNRKRSPGAGIFDGSAFLAKHSFLNDVKHTSNSLEDLKKYETSEYTNIRTPKGRKPMERNTLSVGERSISIFSPVCCEEFPMVYMHSSSDAAVNIAGLLEDMKVILVAVDGVNWDSELSPWPAPKAFRGGNDFSGGADAYLKELIEDIVPNVEALLGFLPRYRAIAGYSLAGLFAIYVLYRTDIFSRAASVSGSLWYDGFLDFMKGNRPLRLPERVYFSLGDHEKITRNQRLASVEDCTAEAEKLVQSYGDGVKTVFELNSGNHFVNVSERVAKGLRWIKAF